MEIFDEKPHKKENGGNIVEINLQESTREYRRGKKAAPPPPPLKGRKKESKERKEETSVGGTTRRKYTLTKNTKVFDMEADLRLLKEPGLSKAER